MLFNNFICLSAASRVAKSLVVLAVLLSMTSAQRSWDGVCLDNNSFSMANFEKDTGDASHMVNGNLFDIMKRRGSKIPSAIQITIDANQGMYNNKVEYCPRSQPMPIKQNRENVPLAHYRDVCFTVKVGPNQLQSAVDIDLNQGDTAENNEQRKADLAELVEELKEFNLGNCLKDMNFFLFASYDQTLFTTAEFKYYWDNGEGKSNLKTPENVYFVREKLHGTVRDVINDKFSFMTEDKNKYFNDVIIFQMARALNMMHNMHWVHRDIKPDNFYVKKTVDAKIEVYLGEFLNALMSDTEPKPTIDSGEENPEYHVHGGPFYQAKEIKTHMASIEADIYAMGISLVELLTHDDVEDVFVEIEFKGNENKLDNFANEEVFLQDKEMQVVEMHAENELEAVDFDNMFNLDDDMFKFEDTMVNNSPIRDLDMSYENIVAVHHKDNNDRILTAVPSNNRILAGNSYGEIDNEINNDLFGVSMGGGIEGYGTINFNPLADNETKDMINEAENLSDDIILQDHIHTDLSLPSTNKLSLVIENNTIETVQKDLIKDLVTEDIFINEEFFDDRKTIDDPSVVKTAEGNKFVGAQFYLKTLITNMMSNEASDRLINSQKNSSIREKCNTLWNKHKNNSQQYLTEEKKSIMNMKDQNRQNLIKKNFQQIVQNLPSTLECVMLFAAKSIRQKKKSDKADDNYDYFGNLDVSRSISTMEHVFEIIIEDRMQSYTHETVKFDQYMNHVNRHDLLLI